MRLLDIKQNKKRRTYSERFKAEIVAQCLAGDESIASVAMGYEINANLIHRWITDHRRHGRYDISQFEDDLKRDSRSEVENQQNWLAIMPNQKERTITSQRSGDINLELNSGKLSLKLTWPGSDQRGLARFIKELMA